MAAHASGCRALFAAATLGLACLPEAPASLPAQVAPASPRTWTAVDAGGAGTSRNLLQHFRARDLAGGAASIPAGDALRAESTRWRLPFQSKRMVAALLTTAARGAIDELSYTLAPHATFGYPDSRRPHERPIFAPGNPEAFFEGLRAAAARLDASAPYTNPTRFLMGLQEHIRTGAEPMWAYYATGPNRILFRFRTYGQRAAIDYVGFHRAPGAHPPADSALGPPVPMMPGVRTPDGRVIDPLAPTMRQPMRRRTDRH